MASMDASFRPVKSPRGVGYTLNGWRFLLFGHRVTTAAIKAGSCQIGRANGSLELYDAATRAKIALPVGADGTLRRSDGSPLQIEGIPVDVVNGHACAKPLVNFITIACGMDGTILSGRRETGDKEAFYAGLMAETKAGSPFSQALHAETGKHGVIVFQVEGKKIVFPTARENVKVILTAQRVLGTPSVFIFLEESKEYVGECGIDLDYGTFFHEPNGVTTRYVALEKRDGIFEASILGYTLRFGGHTRRPGEIIAIRFDGDSIQRIHTIAKRNQLTCMSLPGQDNPKILIIGGDTIAKPKMKAMGLSEFPKVSLSVKMINENPRGHFWFGGKNYILGSVDVKRLGLRDGECIEIDHLGSHVSAVVVPRLRGERINFRLNWRWNGERFVFAKSTYSDFQAGNFAGMRIIEQAQTWGRPDGKGELLAFMSSKRAFLPRIPWKHNPRPISVLVRDGNEILFFTDHERFTKEDWGFSEIIAASIDLPGEKKEPTVSVWEKVAALEKKAGADIFDLDSLKEAQSILQKAFREAPRDAALLEALVRIKKDAIIKEEYHHRRDFFVDWLSKTFNMRQSKEDQLEKLEAFIASHENNPRSVAYFLEILFGIAEGKYAGNKELFRVLCRLVRELTYAHKPLVKRILLSLGILARDPDLSHIVDWMLSDPPPGREALNQNRRQSFGITAEIPLARTNWPSPNKKLAFANGSLCLPQEKLWQEVVGNRGLVMKIANQYLGRGLEFEDLVHEGIFGLYRAYQKRDPNRSKEEFVQYCCDYIRSAILDAIKKTGKIIRLPKGRHEQLSLLNRTREKLERSLGHPPTRQEIADSLGKDIFYVDRILLAARQLLFLSDPQNQDDESNAAETIANPASPNPEAEVMAVRAKEVLREAMQALPERRRRILNRRFGLDGMPPSTLEELAAEQGVTKERIRQIEAAALRKIKQDHPELADLLS